MMKRRPLAAATTILILAACSTPDVTPEAATPLPAVSPEVAAIYGEVEDNGHLIPAVPAQFLLDEKARREVDYWSDEKTGTIIVDSYAPYLYQVLPNDRAMRYTVAVGAAGYGYEGEAHIPYQRDWPSWKPTDNMVATQPETYGPVEAGLEGGLDNPLGARALYLHNSKGDTFYRIHGTMDPSSIGQATSAGCIRLFNQDIIHLAERTGSMTKVIVLSKADSGQGTVPPGKSPPSIATTSDTQEKGKST